MFLALPEQVWFSAFQRPFQLRLHFRWGRGWIPVLYWLLSAEFEAGRVANIR
jgi:hypothetical protein